jgi:Protein of unknown function (DUF4038)/Putative collagen-binding domain of a collagenase
MRPATHKLTIAVVAVAVVGVGASSVWRSNHDDTVRVVPHKALSYAAAAGHRFIYPLKVSSNGRYLVDQRNVPFLIVGDSPQAMIGNLSVKDAATYVVNRKAAGFNALWVNLLCVKYTGCRDDGTTFDGIKPFRTPGDLSTPNPAYFARADAMIRLAAKAGILVVLDPIETGGWLGILRKNGIAKARAYGRFLGKRYRGFGNIIWMSGNDFQTWRNASDDAVVLAVAKGIRSADREHLQTVELDYLTSGSRDDLRWRSVTKLSAAYTYFPTYAQVLKEYNRRPAMPVFMIEAGYEFEQNSPSISKGDPEILRRQEYWSVLSGATGQFYGNHYTWPFADGWKEHLDTPGSVQMGYLVRLFAGRRWFRLVPDQTHMIVTAGYGTFSTTGNVGSSNYVTTAVTRDRKLAMSYVPNGGTLIVNIARFSGPVDARWYDPASGKYESVPRSPFAHSRKVGLRTPGKNADGDRDWVLVLSAR